MAIDIYMTFENDTDITPEAYVALRGLKGDTGDKGSDGNDGVGIEGITQNLDGTLTITLDDGSTYDTEPLRGEDGQDGVDGQDGADGNGIESAVLNADYTLTLTFTDGTSYTTPSIRGAQGEQGVQGVPGEKGEDGESIKGDEGNGIASAVLNADYTLTLFFTDGTSYTTGSIRGEKGEKGDPGDAGQVDTAMSSTSTLPVQNKVIKSYVDSGLSGKANSADIPTKVSDLTNDSGFITGYTETDPTVPSWAKASSKPTYTASEVGALPSSTFIPSKVSDLTNDSGYITGYTETDPVFTASPAHGISASDISNWNGKSDFSGAYADLTGKPSEMTVAEAETGTETTAKVISPAVLNSYVESYVAPYEELTANISMTTGTLLSYVCYRFGHVYYLKIVFQSSGTVAPGANLAAGSVTLPDGIIEYVTGSSYYGANTLVFSMWGTGTDSANFVIRHAGTANITMTGTQSGTITLTWIA